MHICMSQVIRSNHKIYVWGTDFPAPRETFEQIFEKFEHSERAKFVDNLSKFYFASPTPIQMQAIPVMLKVNLHSPFIGWSH